MAGGKEYIAIAGRYYPGWSGCDTKQTTTQAGDQGQCADRAETLPC